MHNIMFFLTCILALANVTQPQNNKNRHWASCLDLELNLYFPGSTLAFIDWCTQESFRAANCLFQELQLASRPSWCLTFARVSALTADSHGGS